MLPGIVGQDPATLAAIDGTTDPRRVRELSEQDIDRKLDEMVQRHLEAERRRRQAWLDSLPAATL